MATTASNPDFNVKHASWIKDAQNKNFTALDIEVTKEFTKQMKLAQVPKPTLVPKRFNRNVQ